MLSLIYLGAGIAVLAFTFWGAYSFCIQHLKVCPEFVPILFFSSISILVQIGGLLGMLYEGVVAVVTAGLILGIWQTVLLVKNRQLVIVVKTMRTFGLVFFSVAAAAAAVFYSGSILLSMDDFNFWGGVVVQMEKAGAFPGQHSFGLHPSFQDYPLGMACLLYYSRMLLTKSESLLLWAQMLVNLACLSCLFTLIPSSLFKEAKSSVYCIYSVSGYVAYLHRVCGVEYYARFSAGLTGFSADRYHLAI